MSGVSNIIEIIEAKTTKRVDEIIKNAEEQKQLILQQAQEKAKIIEEDITKKAERDYKAAISREKAGAKLKAKYQILESKESILKSILEEVSEKTLKVVKGKKYAAILTKLIVDAGEELDVESIELVFPKGQAAVIELPKIKKALEDKIGRKVSVSISKETVRASGGVIIRTVDGLKWVDNTFENRLERFNNDVRDRASKILFEE